MKVEIYRKRNVFNACIIDEKPETVFYNVCNVEITQKYLYGNIDGEQLTIRFDHVNYKYNIE